MMRAHRVHEPILLVDDRLILATARSLFLFVSVPLFLYLVDTAVVGPSLRNRSKLFDIIFGRLEKPRSPDPV